MKFFCKNIYFIIIIILIIISFFLYFHWSIGLMKYIIQALIALLGVYVTAKIAFTNVNKTIENTRDNVNDTIKASYENKKIELLDNLDSKSEWRKQLYDVASKTFITTDDVYRVLASLRYLPKNSDSDKSSTFSRPTREIYKEMYSIIRDNIDNIDSKTENAINEKDKKPVVFLSFEHSEKVRLYTKFLLKHHWEYNNFQEKNKFIKNEEEIFNEIKKEVRKVNSLFSYLSKQSKTEGVSSINYKE
ncbi:hypothetical protein AST11_09815 [Staphylococcus saprophyticus]|nr:hypothetical protein AST11_09815 [Staphylococcus saprophyticus]